VSIRAYKDKEVEKIIQSAFQQFNIVDPNEMSDIASSIRNQLDTSAPLTYFTENFRAYSSGYRANVRNALIDIIAQLLHSKDLSNSLNQLEGKSRQMVDSASRTLQEMEKKLLTIGSKFKESFEEGLDAGEHHNTMIKDGKLRVNRLDNRIEISDVRVEVAPAESVTDQVAVDIAGSPLALIRTGVGSDSYKVGITSSVLPSAYYAEQYFSGTLIKVFFETESSIPMAVSAKCSNAFRVISFEGYNNQEEAWNTLGTDETLGNFSFVSVNTSSPYTRYKVVLHNPDYTVDDGMYKLETIIHNIKLFKKDQLSYVEKGQFISYPIPAKESLLKAIFDASYEGIATFWIDFISDTSRERVLVVPKDETLVKWCASYNGKDAISLPAVPVSTTIAVVNLQDDEIIAHSYDAGENSVTLNNYSIEGYVFISFDLSLPTDMLGPDTNEAVVENPKYFLKSEKHNNVDGYVFPISSIPWRTAGMPTFTIKNSLKSIEAEEVAPSADGMIDFDPDKSQYYYFNGNLYTNFNLIDSGSDITVEYNTLCDAVRVIIDLTNDATVDEYMLEIIEHEQNLVSI